VGKDKAAHVVAISDGTGIEQMQAYRNSTALRNLARAVAIGHKSNTVYAVVSH